MLYAISYVLNNRQEKSKRIIRFTTSEKKNTDSSPSPSPRKILHDQLRVVVRCAINTVFTMFSNSVTLTFRPLPAVVTTTMHDDEIIFTPRSFACRKNTTQRYRIIYSYYGIPVVPGSGPMYFVFLSQIRIPEVGMSYLFTLFYMYFISDDSTTDGGKN